MLILWDPGGVGYWSALFCADFYLNLVLLSV
jgi:hypothetical protein